MSTTETHAAVEALLQSKFITFKINYAGETRQGDWACDQWGVNIFAPLSKPSVFFPYDTGLGLRKTLRKRYAWEDKAPTKPIAPHIAAVLHSSMLDSESIDMSFDNWCDNFGGNTDSIKSFNMYRECCEFAKKFRPLFDRDTYQQLSKLLEDY